MSVNGTNSPALPRSLRSIGWLTYVVVSLISPRFDFKAIVADRPYLALQQLADPALLHHNLVDTLWNLHMQPPLYNLEVALLLQIPVSLGAFVARLLCGALFVATGVWSYKAMVRLGVKARWAFWVVVVLIYLNPANLFYGLSILYVGTAAALTTALAYHAICFIQDETPQTARRFVTTGVLLSLYVTSLQPVVFLGIVAVVAFSSPSLRRALGRGALVPLLVLFFFIGHTVLQFATPLTSTWGGMNLARVTTDLAPRHDLALLIARNNVTKLALSPAFSTLREYGALPTTKGPLVRQQVFKASGDPNFNNDAYRRVAAESFSNSWHYIQRRPGRYVRNVARGLGLWLVPSQQYFLSPTPTSGVLASYEHMYDVAINWQTDSVSPRRSQASLRRHGVGVANWSFLALIMTAGALVGGICLVVARWRRHRGGALAILVPWLLFTQGLLIMNLSDIGENQRFRFQLGSISLILLTVTVHSVAKFRKNHFL